MGRYKILTEDASATPEGVTMYVIWDTQADKQAINGDTGYAERYKLRESAEEMTTFLNASPEEQAAMLATNLAGIRAQDTDD